MKLSPETIKAIYEDLDKEVDQRIKTTPVRIIIDGMEIDINQFDREGGEINLYVGTPLFCAKTDKYYNLAEVKKEGI
ncbi:MAG: hypothetical protein KAS32_10100 [Candidatus Peribacteraceae bacterium]|nr:hypothetical protein [Candidatus Peribacteraceae bacterium]